METQILENEMEKKRLAVIKRIEGENNKLIAERTGLAPGYISNIKAGRHGLDSYKKLLNIAKSLGI